MADIEQQTAPVMQEIASTADGRDVTRGYVDNLALLSPQDSILIGRGGGDYRVYEEILRDGQVQATFQQRRGAVVAREWTVEAGGTKRLDVKAADFVREMLAAIDFDAVTNKMLYGIFYGFAVAECLWARDGAYVTLGRLVVRNRRRFRFAPDGSLRLLTMVKPNGEALPPRKFWTFATGADNDDDPYGLGLAYWLYWPVYFKRNGLKFWLIFLEKFGVPTAIGEYPANARKEDRDKLLEALKAIQTDAGIIIPQGMMVRLLEAQRSGNIDQRTFISEMNAEISKTVLSQTMTTDNGSSRAQGEVHMDVRQDVIKSDADLVCKSLANGPLRWLTEWNFPGAAVPQVWRKLDEAPDLKSEAERDEVITRSQGVRRTMRHIVDTYGGEWETAPAQPQVAAPAEPEASPAFAEPPAGDTAAVLTDKLESVAAGAMDGLLDGVRKIVDEAKTLEEVRDRLLDEYGEMDPGDLATVMQRALVAAELAGRLEVKTDSEAR